MVSLLVSSQHKFHLDVPLAEDSGLGWVDQGLGEGVWAEYNTKGTTSPEFFIELLKVAKVQSLWGHLETQSPQAPHPWDYSLPYREHTFTFQ